MYSLAQYTPFNSIPSGKKELGPKKYTVFMKKKHSSFDVVFFFLMTAVMFSRRKKKKHENENECYNQAKLIIWFCVWQNILFTGPSFISRALCA